MVSLFEGLIIVKNLRKIHLKFGSDEKDEKEEINELITLYAVISKKSEYLNDKLKGETVLNYKGKNIKQLKNQFTFYWNNLTQEKQDKLVDRLFCIKILPEIVSESLEMFGGRFVSVI